MSRTKDHPTLADDSATDQALWDLARILMEIAKTAGRTTEGKPDVAGPSDSKTKGKRKSSQRRVKGGQRRDRK